MSERTTGRLASRRRRWLLGGAALLAVALPTLALTGGCSSTPRVAVGEAAPDFALEDDRGREFRLQERLDAGKIVVLSFYPQDDTPG